VHKAGKHELVTNTVRADEGGKECEAEVRLGGTLPMSEGGTKLDVPPEKRPQKIQHQTGQRWNMGVLMLRCFTTESLVFSIYNGNKGFTNGEPRMGERIRRK